MNEELERLVYLLEKTNAPIWGIWTKDGKRKPDFDGESLTESIAYLREVFPYLSKEKYEIRYRPVKSNQKGQFIEQFDLTEPKKSTMFGQQNNQIPAFGGGGNMSPEIFKFLMDIQGSYLKMEFRVQMLEENYKKLDKEMQEVYNDLTDENPKNNKSAIEKLGGLIQSAPSLMNSVKSAKELF